MRRTLIAAGATLAVLTTAPLAMAQRAADFGQQGQFILSADRLLPFFGYTSYSVDGPTGGGVSKNTTTVTQTNLSFFYGSTPNFSGAFNGGNAGAELGTNLFYTVPRIGLDYVIIPNVTIGGDIILYFTLGGSTGTEVDMTNGMTTTTTSSNPSVTLFGLAPRGGYILPLNDMFSLWLRGGFSYYTVTAKATNNNESATEGEHQPAIDLEPQIVFTPIPHVGFTAGLTLDIPFAGGVTGSNQNGGQTVTTTDSASVLYFGLTLGMLAHF
jgi:hypothetical protein